MTYMSHTEDKQVVNNPLQKKKTPHQRREKKAITWIAEQRHNMNNAKKGTNDHKLQYPP